MNRIEIGRMLRAGTTGFVFGCRVSQLESPGLGALVSADLGQGIRVFGLITELHIEDDGLIRQLAAVEHPSPEVIADNRLNRNIPVEISVLVLGHQKEGMISHLLPPRPPLSLDAVYLCSDEDIVAFTGNGRFGYLRQVLRAKELPIAELLACHLVQAQSAHSRAGNPGWLRAISRELITLLRDDYAVLMDVLGAIADTGSI